MELISRIIQRARQKDYYPDIPTIEGSSTRPEVKVGSRDVLMFSSNDYLGVAADPRVKEKIIKAARKYGMGSGGSRMVSGNLDIQEQLEQAITRFKGAEAAIVFATGYMANVATLPALARYYPSVFGDELNHASIEDGCKLSKAEVFIYRHKDMADLKEAIESSNGRGRLIVTDSLFSMDGDIADLPKLVEYKKRYDAVLMIDDAHASGVLGANGRGAMEHYSLTEGVDVIMGTFSKSFGGVGGFICGSEDLIDYLRFAGRAYVFSAPIPPAISAGIVEAIKIVESEPERRERLWENTNYLRAGLQQLGFDLLGSESQIMPIFIGDEKKAIKASRGLLEKGIFVPCARWPVVNRGKARLRITVMSSHEHHHIDRMIDVLERLDRKLDITGAAEAEGSARALVASSA